MAPTDFPATHRALRCVVVTPERAVLDEATDFVAVPMADGELGVEPGRLPLIGRLGYGELRIGHGPAAQHWYVDGGFVQVRADVVTLLTARAVKASAIKVEAAQAALAAAHRIATTPAAQEAMLRDQDRARAQLRIAARAQEEATGVPVAASH
jgi:F-type H+-transporting ATPase subunit epsilon